jgi:hypothetical protein
VDKDGNAVAHEAAENGCLPSDFDQWDLTDINGRTVAQAAYDWDNLPPNFDRWDLIKKD